MTTGLYKAVIEGRFQQVKFYLESGVRLGRHGGNEVRDVTCCMVRQHIICGCVVLVQFGTRTVFLLVHADITVV